MGESGEAGEPPLVSCVMPTTNRRPFVAQALRHFLRQDYPARELIVVDDGDDPVGDLLPTDPAVRYVRLNGRRPLGAKLNVGCAEARGELVARWDDADWQAPDRLTRQADRLSAGGAQACGAGELLVYRVDQTDAWTYRPPGAGPDWLAPGTLLFRKSLWAAGPFPDADRGAEDALLARCAPERVLALSGPRLAFTVARGASALGSDWRPAALAEVVGLIGADRPFYAELRNGPAPLAPAGAADSLTFASLFFVYDGYGSMAEYLALGLNRGGARVNVLPLRIDRAGLSAEFLDLLARSRPAAGAPALAFCPPWESLARLDGTRELYLNTMWETSRIPAGWLAGPLGRARGVVVPSRFVAGVFRACGVTAPVEVVPHGIDPAVYSFEERPERPGVTTLIAGTFTGRKHVREGIAAWKQAFAGAPDARLLIKARFRYGAYTPDDPRIEFVDSEETTRGIAHWYRRADVLLALGNEGFGLPLVEGMATGLPVIALATEGQADVCEEAADRVLPVGAGAWEAFDEPPFGACGVRAVPDVAAVADRLRWVARHRNEARAMGRAAAEWVTRHRNVWAMGPAMLDAVERWAGRGRALRRGEPAAG